jgi:hypothetical protein
MKAETTGRALHDPKRFKTRREPKVDAPLGPPPKWMKDKNALEAWRTFTTEIPWLNYSHRSLVEIASMIRGRLMAGDELSIAGLTLLRICLSQMGASPADASKVSMPEENDDQDPSAKYF